MKFARRRKKEGVESSILMKSGYFILHYSHRNTILKYWFPAGLQLHFATCSQLHSEESFHNFYSFSFMNCNLLCET